MTTKVKPLAQRNESARIEKENQIRNFFKNGGTREGAGDGNGKIEHGKKIFSSLHFNILDWPFLLQVVC
jgi:hypothetical protein